MAGRIQRRIDRAVREFRKPENDKFAYRVACVSILVPTCLCAAIIIFAFGSDHQWTSVMFATGANVGCALSTGMMLIARKYDLRELLLAVNKGMILDCLLPPEEAEYRILEIDIAMDRWILKYGPKRAQLLYAWQSVLSVALFWFDRVVVKVLARK